MMRTSILPHSETTMNNRSVSCLGVSLVLALAACQQSDPPVSYAMEDSQPLRFQIRPGVTRLAELVGDGRIDISVVGDFIFQRPDGTFLNNPDLARHPSEDGPNVCAVSRQIGEQACLTGSASDDRIALHLRHWAGPALTVDDCRDLGQLVTVRGQYAPGGAYAIGAVDHVEVDGKGCSFALAHNNQL